MNNRKLFFAISFWNWTIWRWPIRKFLNEYMKTKSSKIKVRKRNKAESVTGSTTSTEFVNIKKKNSFIKIYDSVVINGKFITKYKIRNVFHFRK